MNGNSLPSEGLFNHVCRFRRWSSRAEREKSSTSKWWLRLKTERYTSAARLSNYLVMSFDVYLQSFHNGEFSGVPREQLRSAFGAHLTEPGPGFWQIRYDDANSSDLYLTPHDADASVHGFSVHRPCSDPRLWDALAAILTLGNVVLYFPGGRAPLVARSTVVQHLPRDMVEALGQPMVVTTGKEIQNEIEGA